MSRTEQDFLGQREIADDVYYGVQTIRGRENFHITGIPMSQEPYFVKALGYVKKAAAMANRDLGVLDAKIADAIIKALRPRHLRRDDGPVRHRLHPGRRRHLDQHERQRGDRQPRARNRSATRRASTSTSARTITSTYGQSTNDVYPTAFRLALILRLDSYITALRQLQDAFFAKGREFDRVLKMGRTHLQDAVPMSLGSEFRGWGTTIGEEVDRIYETRNLLREINLGATAIGTSVTAAPGYPKVAVRHLTTLTNVEFILASDLVEATSDTGAYVQLSGVLKRTAVEADQDLQRHPPARVAVRAAGSTRSTCRSCSRAPRSCPARSIR